MNGPMAFCPRCQKDVLFIEAGSSRRCTICGLEFQPVPPVYEPDFVTTAVMTVGHVLLRVFLILVVVLLVGLAILFASCALQH